MRTCPHPRVEEIPKFAIKCDGIRVQRRIYECNTSRTCAICIFDEFHWCFDAQNCMEGMRTVWRRYMVHMVIGLQTSCMSIILFSAMLSAALLLFCDLASGRLNICVKFVLQQQ